MIKAPSPSFYTLRATGEVAELIASVFSPGITGDIIDVTVLSKNFNNDIEPIHELSNSIELLKSGLDSSELVESTTFNPLYLPTSVEALDSVLDVESRSDNVRFTGMNGDPFVLKNTSVSSIVGDLIDASVSYHQFELPSFDEIISRQTTDKSH